MDMRKFNFFEQEIIKKAIELDEKQGSLNVLGNILEYSIGKNHIPDYCYINVASVEEVTIKIKKDEFVYYTEKNGVEWIRKLDDDLTRKLLTIVTLFEYLSEKRLAFFIGDIDFKALGEVWADTEYVDNYFLEKEVKELLYKYTRKRIYISETLKVIARNGFKTDEEVETDKAEEHNNRQLFFTQIAVAITFLGLLVSIAIPILGTTAVDIKNNNIPVGISSSEINLSNKDLSFFLKESPKRQKELIDSINMLVKSKEQHETYTQTVLQKMSKRVEALEAKNNNSVYYKPNGYIPFHYAPSYPAFGNR